MAYQKKKKEPYDQRTAALTPEEQALREENLRARENMDRDGVMQLCSVICLNAIRDYPKMVRKLAEMEQIESVIKKFRKDRDPRGRKRKHPEKFKEDMEKLREDIQDCEDFFESEMFETCTGISGKQEVIRKIRKMTPAAFEAIERRLARG